jgi:hypothetical protein
MKRNDVVRAAAKVVMLRVEKGENYPIPDLVRDYNLDDEEVRAVADWLTLIAKEKQEESDALKALVASKVS